jgi:ketosteroid isomerase-like protein
MRRFLSAALLAAAITTPAFAEDVPTTIIAIERAALDRSDKGDVKGFLEISATDVVYQDPSLTQPLKGLEALTAYYKGFPVGEPSHGVMKDATVQQYGELAVLSFHYTSGATSKHPVEWNTTEVYRKTEAGWRIVNTHWSLTTAKP